MMNSYVLDEIAGIAKDGGGGAFLYLGCHVMFCQKQGYVVRAKLGKSTVPDTKVSPFIPCKVLVAPRWHE